MVGSHTRSSQVYNSFYLIMCFRHYCNVLKIRRVVSVGFGLELHPTGRQPHDLAVHGVLYPVLFWRIL